MQNNTCAVSDSILSETFVKIGLMIVGCGVLAGVYIVLSHWGKREIVSDDKRASLLDNALRDAGGGFLCGQGEEV